MTHSKVLIRPPAKSDEALIYSTWRNALYYADKSNAEDSDAFYSRKTEEIARVLKDPETIIRVACLSDNPDQIIGYSVFRGTHLLWVYVKIDYRKNGVGQLLVNGFETVDTPKTKIGKAIVENKNLKVLND